MKVALLTISDSVSRASRRDESGKRIKELIEANGATIIKHEVVPDDKRSIQEKLLYYCDELNADVILTVGGTGFSPRDVTPEATEEIIERQAPGLAELMRLEGTKKTKQAALSRSVCGLRKRTLIINLPGSVRGAEDSLGAIIDLLNHAIDMISGKGH